MTIVKWHVSRLDRMNGPHSYNFTWTHVVWHLNELINCVSHFKNIVLTLFEQKTTTSLYPNFTNRLEFTWCVKYDGTNVFVEQFWNRSTDEYYTVLGRRPLSRRSEKEEFSATTITTTTVTTTDSQLITTTTITKWSCWCWRFTTTTVMTKLILLMQLRRLHRLRRQLFEDDYSDENDDSITMTYVDDDDSMTTVA